MWLRCTTDEGPTMINVERILKIVEKPREQGSRGCRLFVSITEYIDVDQTYAQLIDHLGFQDRT